MTLPSKLFEECGDDHDTITCSSRHKTFVYRNGCKLHSFSPEEAPWPFSYNREVLEQCALDHALIAKLTNTQSFVDFTGRPPRRCLDLGTALGDWVVNMAQTFPECTFVGFDLVDVQINRRVLSSSLAKRIEWVHGNFLTHRLPFKANEFDYIHLEGVGLAVPEDKWHWLLGELHRVLAPEGLIEILQQDAMFPVLPRWFTDPLHAHLERRTPILPGRERQASLPRVSKDLPHVHVLLEELFYAVFESRFINPTPSSILPDYFTTIFRHVQSPPLLRLPMPPIPPLVPRADEVFVPPEGKGPRITNDPSDPTVEFMPAPKSSASSVRSVMRGTGDACDARRRSSSTRPSFESTSSSSFQLERSSSFTSEEVPIHVDAQRRHSVATLTPSETTTTGSESVSALFHVEKMQALPSDSLFMHLYQAVHTVLGVREAMWDELKRRVDAKDGTLEMYGWKPEDYDPDVSRDKFDALIERYRGDMQVRLSLWYSLVKAGWHFPRREPLSNLEMDEEEKLRKDILDARKYAKEEEFATPSRSIRLLLGVKGN